MASPRLTAAMILFGSLVQVKGFVFAVPCRDPRPSEGRYLLAKRASADCCDWPPRPQACDGRRGPIECLFARASPRFAHPNSSGNPQANRSVRFDPVDRRRKAGEAGVPVAQSPASERALRTSDTCQVSPCFAEFGNRCLYVGSESRPRLRAHAKS
jgi:hypothetical protein